MPYRELINASSPCHVCEDAMASAACDYCRKPTCARHLGDRAWCSRCDDAYYEFMHREGERPFAAMGPLVGGMIVIAVAPLIWAPLFVGSIAYVIAAFPLLRWRSKRKRRAAFIARVRTTGLLPPGKPDDEGERALQKMLRRNQSAILDRHVDASDP